MSTEWDDLERRLNELGSDVGDGPLPGPHAARRRARQRTLGQVAGATLGAVAVAAVGAAILGGLGPVSIAQPEPAGTPTSPPSTGDAVEPSPSATDGELSEIPDSALMTVDDIAEDFFSWTTADEERPDCFPAIDVEEFIDRAQVTYASETVPLVDYASHDVYLVEPGKAADVVELLVQEAADCAQLTPGRLRNVGDDGYYLTYTYDIGGDMLVEFSVVRRGDVVSVVTRWYWDEHPQATDFETSANAAERMCEVIFGASCVTNTPEYDPPESDSPADWLLTEDEVNPVGTRDPFIRGRLSEGIDTPSWESLCIDDPGLLDVEMLTQEWTDFNDANLFQVVLRFPTTDAADQWLRGYTAIEQRCNSFNVEDGFGTVTDSGVLDLSDAAIAWSVHYTPPEAGEAFHGAGMARRDNVVVLLAYGAMEGPEGPGDWTGYASERLEVFLDRSIGSQP